MFSSGLTYSTKPRIRAHFAPFLHASGFGHLCLVNSIALAFEGMQPATFLLGLRQYFYSRNPMTSKFERRVSGIRFRRQGCALCRVSAKSSGKLLLFFILHSNRCLSNKRGKVLLKSEGLFRGLF